MSNPPTPTREENWMSHEWSLVRMTCDRCGLRKLDFMRAPSGVGVPCKETK